MRIALLTEKYPPDTGGLAISAERLAHLLATTGTEIHVAAPTKSVAAGQTTTTHTTTTHNTVTIHRVGAYRRTDETLSTWFDTIVYHHTATPFDLLHGYFIPQAGFVATFAGHYLGIPSVVSARGNDLDRAIFEPSKAAHILYALQHATAVTANTHDLVRKAQTLMPSRTATCIPNGVDTTHFTPGPRDDMLLHRLGLEHVPILGFVGEARAKKGLAPMLMAYRQVAQQRLVALLIVGGVREGDAADMLTVFQKQNPTLPLIIIPFVDFEHMPTYYRLFDIVLMPSLHDGLPNALLEGMACACATIGTQAGGIPDALHHMVHGILVPPGNVDALAQAMLTLLDDAALRLKLGQQARTMVEHHFTLEQERANTLAVYRQIGLCDA